MANFLASRSRGQAPSLVALLRLIPTTDLERYAETQSSHTLNNSFPKLEPPQRHRLAAPALVIVFHQSALPLA